MHDFISLDRLTDIFSRFHDLKIGLVGDLFLDRYLEIPAATDEQSIETGLVAYQVSHVRNSPGALGTVMNNLRALGVGTLVPVTIIGDDGHGFDLMKTLESMPADLSHVLRVPGRLTPTYTKPMKADGDGWRELNRLDIRTRRPLDNSDRNRLCARLERVFNETDGMIVLDQIADECGVVDEFVRERLLSLCRRRRDRLTFVDSRNRLSSFSTGTLKGNRPELLAAAGFATDQTDYASRPDCNSQPDDTAQPDAVERAARKLSGMTKRDVYATLGGDGILVTPAEGTQTRIPAIPLDSPLDIVGAGDSVTAGMVAALLAEAEPVEAAAIGNLVASITVQQIGTTGTATPNQVFERWSECR